jgi:DNA-directed RNA polymerase specialized sigma24 family protein
METRSVPAAAVVGTTPTAATDSVTYWLHQLGAGNPAAAQHFWEQYFDRLLQLARRKLGGTQRRMADEEDVALSAFNSFCHGVARGRFLQLRDWNNLWGLLVRITVRKAANLARHEGRQKRGGGQVDGEVPVPAAAWDAEGDPQGLDQILSREPTPKTAAQVAEEFQRRLAQLETAELRSIALWKLEGYTNAEIATRLDCAVGTVERKLRLIRTVWS